MHSYEDRIRAVELYFRYGKRLTVVVRELGYLTCSPLINTQPYHVLTIISLTSLLFNGIKHSKSHVRQ
jgi:hypothetical protein